MRNLLIGLLSVLVLGTGGYAAAAGLDDDPARTVSLPSATTPGTTTTGTTTDDTTTGATTTAGTTTAATTTDEVEDVSGPCDEAEHANDPRCTGIAGTPRADDDNGDHGGDDDDHAEDRDDSSGHGSGDDDHDDDRSGANSGKG